MQENAVGIVIRTRSFTDTSLIVHWLTLETGRISTVAKGARRPKSAFFGRLDLFYEADLSFVRSRRSELHQLREVELRETHSNLRVNLAALHQASYAIGLVEQLTETDTPVPEVYQLFREYLHHLATHAPQPRSLFAIELKLLRSQGLLPDLRSTRLSTSAATVGEQLVALDWPQIPLLSPSTPAALELRAFLPRLLEDQLGRLARGRAEALELSK